MSNLLVLQINKFYSRDWLVRGRIRVELKDAQGKPVVSDIPTRKSNKTFSLCIAPKGGASVVAFSASCTSCMQVLH